MDYKKKHKFVMLLSPLWPFWCLLKFHPGVFLAVKSLLKFDPEVQ